MTNPATGIARKTVVPYEFPPPPFFADPARRAKLALGFPEIRRALEEFQDEQHIPGIAFGVVIDGELAYADALGVRHVETNAPVTCNSVFRIASMSKSFAAMAVLRLRDERKLRLEDAAAEYIPEFKSLRYPTSDSPAITIRHLLTMASGLPEDNAWGDRQMAIGDGTFREWLAAGIPFANAPDTAFEYSNYGYSILGRIVSCVSGMPFQEYINQSILQPLGMNATVWDRADVPPDQLAHGYRYEKDLATGTFRHLSEPVVSDGAFAAMAGLFTTIPDFARYMSFLLDAFPPRGVDDCARGSGAAPHPLKRSSVREMQQLARFEELVERGSESERRWHAVCGYGLGLAIWHDEQFGHGVSHGGGLPGFGSYYYLLPDHGIGIAAFSNKTYSRLGRVFHQLLNLLERTGGLQPRTILPAPALEKMRNVAQHWLDGGDDVELISSAADNFLLDSDMAHRHAEREAIRASVGAFVEHGEFHAVNALRGKWRIECERGWVDVLLTLAPTMPPTIQLLELTAGAEEPR